MTDPMSDIDSERHAELVRLNRAFIRRLLPVISCTVAVAIGLILCSSLGSHSLKQHLFIAIVAVMVVGAVISWLMVLRFSRQVKALRATQYSQY